MTIYKIIISFLKNFEFLLVEEFKNISGVDINCSDKCFKTGDIINFLPWGIKYYHLDGQN